MKMPKKRRIERKTNYSTRMKLLKSETPRVVVRKTNKYIIAQIVETDIAKDKVLLGATSKILLSKGWPKELQGSLKSLQASYLLGAYLSSL